MKLRNYSALALAALAGLALTASSAFAGDITIVNGDFDTDVGGGTNPVVADWNEGANSWSWTPAGDQLLYLGNTGKVDQDLNHFWSSGDTFTLGITGHEMSWSGVGEAFSVQLRETDGTVLWDSGSQSVDGVSISSPQFFEWTVTASTFSATPDGQQINIQLQCTGGSVFLDDVYLSVEGVDAIAPTLTSTVPADDAGIVYPSPDLVATFTEDIALTGNGSVTISDLDTPSMTTIAMTDASQISLAGAVLTINPTADLNLGTNYAIQISADAIEDLAANPFAGVFGDTTWNFQTITETTPPTLVSTSPADNASGVATDTNLVATFSEPVEAGSGNITIKNLTEATDTVIPVGDGQVSISGTDLTIDLSTDLDPGDSYAIQIEAGTVADTAGNPFAGILAPDVSTWNITTLADTIDPTIIARSPADNATGVNNRIYLVATFSEPIALAGSGDITIKNLSDVTQTVISVTDPEVSVSGDTLTVDPGADLDFGDNYAIQIDTGAITDPSGNPFAGIGDDVTWNFTSRATPTVINIDNAGFENASTNIGNGNLTDIDNWTEDVGDSFVDNNGTSWVPEVSRTLYIGSASVNQDLSHNWSSSNVFTLCLIATNPGWSDNNNTFKVQLRQASDDTVLWDSGDQNVGGTVTTTGPATYTGAGHLLIWTIDASTFAGTENSQLNIRIAHVSGGPVYADNVSLDFTGGGGGGGSAFDTWATSNGVSAGSEAVDSDGGGQNNLYEFGLGGTPTDGNDDGSLLHAFSANVAGDSAEEGILTILVRSGAVGTFSTADPSVSGAADGIVYTVAADVTPEVNGGGLTVTPTAAVTTGLPPAPAGYTYESFYISGAEGYFQVTVESAP